MIADQATKLTDKAKLTGHIRDGKVIVVCTLSHDVLKQAGTICRILQNDDIYIISAFESVIKAVRAIEALESTPLEELPTVTVISRITHSGYTSSYQGVELVNYKNGLKYLQNHQQAYTKDIVTCLKS